MNTAGQHKEHDYRDNRSTNTETFKQSLPTVRQPQYILLAFIRGLVG